jgi:predicted permease
VGEHAEHVTAEMVTASFFPLLGVQPALGRFFASDEDRVGVGAHVVVLSHEFWRGHLGGNRGALGTTLRLGRSIYTVVGVAPEGFAGVGLAVPDMWVPITVAAPEVMGPDALGPHYYWLSGVLARVRPGVDPGHAAAEGTAIYRSRFAQAGDSGAMVSLGGIRAEIVSGAKGGAKLPIWLAAMSAIVLLIACANVANLLLARAVQRKREVAVRLALGASRGRLVRQMLAESAVIAVAGGMVALLVTLWVGPILRASFLPASATASAALDLRILAFAALAVVATAVLAGSAPAYQASAPDISAELKSGEREGRFQASKTRTSLLVGQVALTLVLLTGAGLFVSSLRRVEGLRLGFDPERLIMVSVDLQAMGYKRPAIDALYERMRERVRHVPGVTEASLAVGNPFGSSFAVSLEVPGRDSLPSVKTGGPYVAAVTPDYFGTMGTAVRRGRVFTPTDHAGAQRVAVVNETMARLYWPGEDPIGKCLKVGGRTSLCREIVGTVEDARRNSVTDEVVVQYFIPLAQTDSVMTWPVTALLVRTAGPSEALVGPVRREVQATSEDLPYATIDPMPQKFAGQLRPWRLGSAILSVFGALGLLLAAIGLYGVLSYVVSRRTQEIGVRIALGAAAGDVRRLVMTQTLRIVGIGVLIGTVAALAAGRVIASQLYGVTAHDPLVLSVAVLVLAAVAALASYLPARRATKVDPMVALRYE